MDKEMEMEPEALGDGRWRFKDGRIVHLCEWTRTSLFSCFVVEEGGGCSWSPFYSSAPYSSAPLPRTHTNLPRSGDIGLPKDWEALVYDWRAAVSERLSEEVVGFLDSCSVSFHYNHRIYDKCRLMDLVHGQRVTMMPAWIDTSDKTHQYPWEENEAMFKRAVVLPVHMRENLSYGVDVRCDEADVLSRLRAWQKTNGERPFFCWIYLDCMLKKLVI